LQSQNKEKKSLLECNNIQMLHFEKETKGMANFFERTTCIRSIKESLSVTSIQAHPETPSATPNTPPPYPLMKLKSPPPFSTYFKNKKKPVKSSHQSYTTSNNKNHNFWQKLWPVGPKIVIMPEEE